MRSMRYGFALVFAAALWLAPTPALAAGGGFFDWREIIDQWLHKDNGHGCKPHGPPKAVPEFDPSAVGAIGSIVAGGALVIAARRRKS